jgi:hypothetical protein
MESSGLINTHLQVGVRLSRDLCPFFLFSTLAWKIERTDSRVASPPHTHLKVGVNERCAQERFRKKFLL